MSINTSPAADGHRSPGDRPRSRRPDLGAVAAEGQWYVTAHTVRLLEIDGRRVELPASLAHAKRVGTLTTACGAWAEPWQKICDLPFPIPAAWSPWVHMCTGCLEAAIAEWRS